VLADHHLVPQRITEARKEKITPDAAWDLLSTAREIVVAKGKRHQRFDPRTDDRATILAEVLGRSGTLRAPTLKMGDRFVVGYGEALYAELFP
jgi:hypothetical protein